MPPLVFYAIITCPTLMNMLTLLLSLTSSNTIHAKQERQKGKKGVTDGKLRQEPFYETDGQHTYLYGGSLPLEKKKVCFCF